MIALIGAGYWGKNHLRVLKELKVLSLVCDLDENKKQEYSNFTSNISDVFNEESVKGVVISTPAATHFQIAKQALLAGKHVLVEKPLALSVKEAEKLISLADEKKLVLMVGHILRYHPAFIKLKEIVKTGELGDIRYIWSNRLNFGKIRKEEDVLWSFAPHDISIILDILGEPKKINATGKAYLQKNIADTTLSVLEYDNNVAAHIFVSWLNPFKEQKFSIIGSKRMAVFDGIKNELLIYSHQLNRHNVKGYEAIKKEGQLVSFENKEPLTEEIKHFLYCIKENKKPLTDGTEGLRVLRVLQSCQRSFKNMFHQSSEIQEGVQIGQGTKIWQNCQIQKGAKIGNNCVIGHNCFVGSRAVLGNGVKLESNVDVWDLVILEDNVFVGPSAVFTNDLNPRAKYPKKKFPEYGQWKETLVKEGSSIGANAVIVAGNVIGKCAMIGAGAVVTKDIPDYSIAVGNPARLIGFICECGNKIDFSSEETECKVCNRKYKKEGEKVWTI
jgi:UDP-2-acetamido-3-amino-2,3-dideoxy-glucuronate N-acetyltransferase